MRRFLRPSLTGTECDLSLAADESCDTIAATVYCSKCAGGSVMLTRRMWSGITYARYIHAIPYGRIGPPIHGEVLLSRTPSRFPAYRSKSNQTYRPVLRPKSRLRWPRPRILWSADPMQYLRHEKRTAAPAPSCLERRW